MEAWKTLVANALVGTERQTPQPPRAEGALKQLVNQLDWTQPEKAVLEAAGAIALHQQISQCPAKKNWTLVEPCSLEELPVVGPAIANHLDTAISTYPKVLPELLSLIAKAGQRIPDRQLPKLLQVGQQNSALQPDIAAVVGKRGQWLAEQEPDWSFAWIGGDRELSPESPQWQDIWKNGRHNERVLLFQRWRENNPNAAREAVEAIWSTELAQDRNDRAAFVELLKTNLTIADEPFLEAALDDRSKVVRLAAANLLTCLPKSRLCQRMVERVQTFIQLTSIGEGIRLSIGVTLPEEYKPEWKRDGILKKSPTNYDYPGWWARQILMATPLNFWGEVTLMVTSIQYSTFYERMFVTSCGVAAHRQRRADWAEALLRTFHTSSVGMDSTLRSQLLALLTTEQQEQWLREQLPNNPSEEEAIQWLTKVVCSVRPWTLDFSKLIFEQLITVVLMSIPQNSSLNTYDLSYTSFNLRFQLHPELASDITITLQKIADKELSHHSWKSRLSDLQEHLSFRQLIHHSFQDSG